MTKLLLVGCGGFLGAVCRWGVSGAVQRFTGGTFPAGTLVVNLAGCFVIGALMTLVTEGPFLAPGARVFALTGFLGAFTTFSTFGYETMELMREGAFAGAALNLTVSVVGGLAAVLLGVGAVHWLGRWS